MIQNDSETLREAHIYNLVLAILALLTVTLYGTLLAENIERDELLIVHALSTIVVSLHLVYVTYSFYQPFQIQPSSAYHLYLQMLQNYEQY